MTLLPALLRALRRFLEQLDAAVERADEALFLLADQLRDLGRVASSTPGKAPPIVSTTVGTRSYRNGFVVPKYCRP